MGLVIIGFALGFVIDRAIVAHRIKPIADKLNGLAKEIENYGKEETKGED